MMTKQQMEHEIQRLAPFRHDFHLPYGLHTAPPGSQASRGQHEERVETLTRHAFPALLDACGGSLESLRVLDVASNSGGFSVEARRRGADYVLGIDVVDRYLEQAKFVRAALEVDNVEFKKLDVYDLSVEEVGEFDVTFCFGLLYHLENPVLAMRKISAVTRRVLLLDTNTILTENEELPLWRMNFPSPVSSPDHKGASTSLWRDRQYCQFKPNAIAVRRLLELVGFDTVRLIEPEAENLPEVYRTGRRKTFLAVRES
jgi:tRNA (mo5U34)-methyltransferase